MWFCIPAVLGNQIGEELILSLAQQFIDNRWNYVLHYIHTNNKLHVSAFNISHPQIALLA